VKVQLCQILALDEFIGEVLDLIVAEVEEGEVFQLAQFGGQGRIEQPVLGQDQLLQLREGAYDRVDPVQPVLADDERFQVLQLGDGVGDVGQIVLGSVQFPADAELPDLRRERRESFLRDVDFLTLLEFFPLDSTRPTVSHPSFFFFCSEKKMRIEKRKGVKFPYRMINNDYL